MKQIIFFFISLALLFSVGCGVAYAVSVPQEFYISQAGQLHLRGGEVKIKNAVNVIVVEIWGQRWTVVADYATKFESAYGDPIKPEEILVSHLLEVKGKPFLDKVGHIDASLIRDLTIETGTPSQGIGSLLVDQLCVVQVAATLEKTKVEMQSKLTAAAVNAFSSQTPSHAPPPAREVVLQKTSAMESGLSRELEYGLRGDDVKFVQEFLMAQGYDLGVTVASGYFGAVTKGAVKEFQRANNITPVNGRIGPKTGALILSLVKEK